VNQSSSLFSAAQDVVSEAVDVASDKVVDYGSVALSKADEATNVAARATANKVNEARARALGSRSLGRSFEQSQAPVHRAGRSQFHACVIGCARGGVCPGAAVMPIC